MAYDWQLLILWALEHLDNPEGMLTASSFLGPDRDVWQFRHWHEQGTIEVRDLRKASVSPDDYAGVDLSRGALIRGDPGHTRFAVEVRFAGRVLLPLQKQWEHAFLEVLRQDPGLKRGEAETFLVNRHLPNCSLATRKRAFALAQEKVLSQNFEPDKR